MDWSAVDYCDVLLVLPPNSRLTVKRLGRPKCIRRLVAEKIKSTGSGEVTRSVTDRSLRAGLCGNA